MSARWPAYGAAVAAFAFAVPSLYWALGGTVGLDTLGGEIEERARARDATLVAATWAAAVVKVLGGLLALALVRPWGRRLPERWVAGLAWTGAVLLTVYGLVQTASVGAVWAGLVELDDPPDDRVLLWRLLVWEPWFLVWGILLGVAAWEHRRGRARRGARSAGAGEPVSRP